MPAASDETQPRVIVLTCGGGLCNRLRPLLSAMRIVALTGRRLYFNWTDFQVISSLEQSSSEPTLDQLDLSRASFPGDWTDYFQCDIPRSNHAMCVAADVSEYRDAVARDIGGSILLRGNPGFVGFAGEPDMNFLQSGALTFVHHRIKNEMLDHVDRLRPTKRIQDRIDSFATENAVDSGTIGVHIRWNHPFCGRILLDLYCAAIDQALSDLDRIFLASDSGDVDEALTHRYGSRVVVYPKRSRLRDDPLAIEDSIVDLFLLGRTGRLIGSMGSSFSDMAWWIGKCMATNQLISPMNDADVDSRREFRSPSRNRNLFVFAVAGDDHVRTVQQTLPFLKRHTKNDIVVVTTRSTARVEHDQTIEVTTPHSLTDHQASIYLKTCLSNIVGDQRRTCCYLDSDIVAVNDRVDTIFEERHGVVTFARDHIPMPMFSRHAVHCGCKSGECRHLKDAIADTLGVEVIDERWQHWNGGVFLFDGESAEFMRVWHEYTMLIFDDAYWKTRDQGTLIAAAWKLGLQRQECLSQAFNFIVDPFWGLSIDRRQGLKARDFTVNRQYSLKPGSREPEASRLPAPSILHFINGGVGQQGWKNWDDVARILA